VSGTMKFKVGDKVRCVNDNPHGSWDQTDLARRDDFLVKDKEYTIVAFSNGHSSEIIVDGSSLSYRHERFEAVPPAPTVDEQIKELQDKLDVLRLERRKTHILALLDEIKEKVVKDPKGFGFAASKDNVKVQVNIAS
jgi:exoribonuclease R